MESEATPVTIDKQSVLDAALALTGGILGGVVVGVLVARRYLATPINTAPKSAK